MIMSGPGIPAGSRYDGFIYLSDITPTLYQMLGVKAPESVEGIGHADVMKKQTTHLRKHIYNVYGSWSRSIKTDDGWKLMLYNVEGVLHTQLFNLKDDPWETRNLSELPEQQKRIGRMKELLRKTMLETHDDLNIELPDWNRSAAGRNGRGK
jgi:arylsulfatase A-like enzyme